jgi:hypothetical protein
MPEIKDFCVFADGCGCRVQCACFEEKYSGLKKKYKKQTAFCLRKCGEKFLKTA